MKNMNNTNANANTANVSPISISYDRDFMDEKNIVQRYWGENLFFYARPDTANMLRYLMGETGLDCKTVASELLIQAAKICNLTWDGEPSEYYAAPTAKEPPVMTHPITLHRVANPAPATDWPVTEFYKGMPCDSKVYLTADAFRGAEMIGIFSGKRCASDVADELIRQASAICEIVDDDD